MANSSADDEWTSEQWNQILLDPQQFDLNDLEEVRVNAMQRAKACAKKALTMARAAAKEWAAAALSQRRQACSQMDWKDWDEAAAGRGGDHWVITLLYAS